MDFEIIVQKQVIWECGPYASLTLLPVVENIN